MELSSILVVKIQDPVERFISLKATAKFVVQIPVAVGILHVFSAAFFLLAKRSQKSEVRKIQKWSSDFGGFPLPKVKKEK